MRHELETLRDEMREWLDPNGAVPNSEHLDVLVEQWADRIDAMIARLPPAETEMPACPRCGGTSNKTRHIDCYVCGSLSDDAKVTSPPSDALRAGLPPSKAACRVCNCQTGGGEYCYEHAPYVVYPQKDGSFLSDRGGRHRVFIDDLAVTEKPEAGLPTTQEEP